MTSPLVTVVPRLALILGHGQTDHKAWRVEVSDPSPEQTSFETLAGALEMYHMVVCFCIICKSKAF